MSMRELRERYGGSGAKGRHVVNAAIRVEIPGGGDLLDLMELVHQMRQRGAVPQAVLDRLRIIRDRMAEHVMRDRPKDVAHPHGTGRTSVSAGKPTPSLSRVFQSTPPPKSGGDNGGLKLDALRPSSQDDARASPARGWTPPAAIVEQMGKLPDEQLAALAGVSASLVRDRREDLGIPPVRRGGRRPGAGRPWRA